MVKDALRATGQSHDHRKYSENFIRVFPYKEIISTCLQNVGFNIFYREAKHTLYLNHVFPMRV